MTRPTNKDIVGPAVTASAAVHRQLAGVNWPGRTQLARIKIESLDADHPRVELGVRLQKLSEQLRGYVVATRNRDVRMPGTKLRFDPDSEGRLLHALVNLKQMRMRFAHAYPDDFRGAFCRKRAEGIHGKKKRPELDCGEFFLQLPFNIFGHIAEKPERQMDLGRIRPTHSADVWIKTGKQLAH